LVKEIINRIKEVELNSQMAKKNAQDEANLIVERARNKALDLANKQIEQAKIKAEQNLKLAKQEIKNYKVKLDTDENIEIETILKEANKKQKKAVETLINMII
jgi:vacuolar-type H+-ATPase subunit H